MNYMKKVAGMLGVQLNEEFDIMEDGEISRGFRLTKDGLDNASANGSIYPITLTGILTGVVKIKRHTNITETVRGEMISISDELEDELAEVILKLRCARSAINIVVNDCFTNESPRYTDYISSYKLNVDLFYVFFDYMKIAIDFLEGIQNREENSND